MHIHKNKNETLKKSVSISSFLRNFHTDFYIGYTGLHSHKQGLRDSLANIQASICSHLVLVFFSAVVILFFSLFYFFLILNIPAGVRLNLRVVVICSFLWIGMLNIFLKNVSHLFGFYLLRTLCLLPFFCMLEFFLAHCIF